MFRFYAIYKSKMNTKNVRHGSDRIRPPSPNFLHTCESYKCKTHKCEFKCLPKFKMSLEVSCTFTESCLYKTYKCAVTRKPNKYCREALDSISSKARIWSNFDLLWHPHRSVLFLSVVRGRFGFYFALIRQPFA